MEPINPESLVPQPVDLAGTLEHVLLKPALTETDVAQGVEAAKLLGLAAVVVRPSDLDLAVRWTNGSALRLATVVDVPFGHSSPSAKNFAARDALRRGAKEIDTVMNTGKLVSRQFQYLETELLQMAEACHLEEAILTVVLETDYLNEELKIVACRVCRRAGVDFIASPAESDLPLLKEFAKERLRLKWSGSATTWEQVLALHLAGFERVQSAEAPSIVEAWKKKLADDAQTAAAVIS